MFVFSLNPHVIFCVFSLNPQVFFVCVLTESTGVFCLFSLNPQMVFVCVLTESTGAWSALGTGAERTRWGVWGKQVPVDIVAQFHACIGM